MVSGKNIRIHGSTESSYAEERKVDTPDLRFAEFSALSQPSCIAVLRDRLLLSLQEFNIVSDFGQTQTCMALEESLANAFYHGNLELDSALKEDGSGRFEALARERSQRSPWKDRRIRVVELATPFGIWITIGDEGQGFDVAAALKRAENPLNMLASGRGLIMMNAFTDELFFNAKGNEVTMVIYSQANQDVLELLKNRARSRQTDCGSHLFFEI